MLKLTQSGVGIAASTGDISLTSDRELFAQADVTGTATYRILGRYDEEAQWQEIAAPSSDGFLAPIPWVRQVALEVTSGSGSVDLFVVRG